MSTTFLRHFSLILKPVTANCFLFYRRSFSHMLTSAVLILLDLARSSTQRNVTSFCLVWRSEWRFRLV